MFSKYEKAAMIGIRAEQISKGASPCINIEDMKAEIEKRNKQNSYKIGLTSLMIAEEEFNQGKIPMLTVRPMPFGNKSVVIKTSSMIYR